MAVERRQLLMGGAVVVVLVIAVTLLRPASPAPAPAQTRTQPVRAKSARATADAQTPGPVAPVKLKELADERQLPGEAKRNPFKFVVKAPPPPPPQPPSKLPVIAPQPTEQAKPINSGPPPITLKLIGILERANGVKWAVLSDGKAATPYYGKDGDIVDGRWQIVQIGTESITMTYANGTGKTVIRLTGQ